MKQLFLSLFAKILQRSAQRYLSKIKPYIIWVTGSVGKTSCRLIITDTLKKLLPQEYIYTSPKNYNSDIWLSLSILGIEDYEPNASSALSSIFQALWQVLYLKTKPSILVLEYGIDKPGDMDVLLSIVKPDTAILTAIDLVHWANFPDGEQGIFNEKVKLLLSAKDMILYDNGLNKKWTMPVGNMTTLKFSYEPTDGDIQFDNYKVGISGDRISTSYIYKIYNSQNQLIVTTNTCGMHNIAYQAVGITLADIISHRKKYPSLWELQTLQIPIQLQPGRFTLLASTRGDIIIDSTYNAAPGSMRAVIHEGLQIQQNFFPEFGVILVLWEMRELGEISKSEHEALAQWLIGKHADIVIGVSGDSVCVTDYLMAHYKDLGSSGTTPGQSISWAENSLQAAEVLQHILNENPHKHYVIIFKSSQGEIWLEEAIKPFISPSQRNNLPRQETYWQAKKTFAKKLFVPHKSEPEQIQVS